MKSPRSLLMPLTYDITISSLSQALLSLPHPHRLHFPALNRNYIIHIVLCLFFSSVSLSVPFVLQSIGLSSLLLSLGHILLCESISTLWTFGSFVIWRFYENVLGNHAL